MKKSIKFTLPVLLLLLLASCSKGYEVRVTNYYIEQMDSVLVGDKLVYTDVARQTSTEYKKLAKGTYDITFITKSKNHLGGQIVIPKNKSGKRTIQIDGQGTIAILKD